MKQATCVSPWHLPRVWLGWMPFLLSWTPSMTHNLPNPNCQCSVAWQASVEIQKAIKVGLVSAVYGTWVVADVHLYGPADACWFRYNRKTGVHYLVYFMWAHQVFNWCATVPLLLLLLLVTSQTKQLVQWAKITQITIYALPLQGAGFDNLQHLSHF